MRKTARGGERVGGSEGSGFSTNEATGDPGAAAGSPKHGWAGVIE
jgi:hypothetical protein